MGGTVGGMEEDGRDRIRGTRVVFKEEDGRN